MNTQERPDGASPDHYHYFLAISQTDASNAQVLVQS